MTQEARTIRPFAGLEELDGLFAGSSVIFGRDRCPADGKITLNIDSDEYNRRPVILQWAPEDEFDAFLTKLRSAPDQTGLPAEALSLVVLASTGYLKRTEIIFSLSLDNDGDLRHEQSLVSERRPAPFMAGHHGSSVDVYLLLNRELKREELRPWRKGTWLDHSRFVLATAIGHEVFKPTPLNHEMRARLGLDGRTLRYFELGDHNPLQAYDDQPEGPRFYVDEQLLAELSASGNSPSSKSIQLQLVLDFMTAVINESARRRDELRALSYDDIHDTLLGRVIRAAAGPGSRAKDRQVLFSKVRSDPAKAIARAEHTVDLQRALSGVFRENGS